MMSRTLWVWLWFLDHFSQQNNHCAWLFCWEQKNQFGVATINNSLIIVHDYSACTHTHTHTHAHTHARTHTHTHTCTHACAHMHAHTQTQILFKINLSSLIHIRLLCCHQEGSIYNISEKEETMVRLHFVKFETKYIESCLDFILANLMDSSEFMRDKIIKVTAVSYTHLTLPTKIGV